MNVAKPNGTLLGSATKYYRLVYDPKTKKAVSVFFVEGYTYTPHSLYCATTWPEIQAFAANEGLTGVPEQDPTIK